MLLLLWLLLPLLSSTHYSVGALLCALLSLPPPTSAAATGTVTADQNEVLARSAALAARLGALVRDTMRFDDVEREFAEADYASEPLDGAALARTLASQVSGVLQAKASAVRRIAAAAKEGYVRRATTDEGAQCASHSAYAAVPASDSDARTAARFNVTAASTTYATVRTAPGVCRDCADVRRTVCAVAPSVDEAYAQNYAADPLLTWQYVGTQDGVMIMYPGTEQTRDAKGAYNAYDPRIRPWYAGAAGGPRDVVVVIDKSGSMQEKNRMALARSAAHAVLDTVSARDFVQVVLFDTAAKTTGCLPPQLVRATPRNLSALRAFVDGAAPGGGTNFDAAFRLTFDLVDATARAPGAGSGCRTAILFMTDGVPTDGYDATSVLAQRLRDADGKPRATIFTYALGSGAELQRDMACDSGGTYAAIADGGDLRGQMSAYYQLFAQGLQQREDDESVVWSAPYLDSNGLGMMITASVPVYATLSDDRRRLVGVAGADVVLTELSTLVQKMDGEHSYAFVVNRNGEVIFHPLLRRTTAYLSAPVYQDIAELEQSVVDGAFARQVRAGLVHGDGSGRATLDMYRRVDRGDSAFEGQVVTEVRTTYHWAPAGQFTVCYALAEDETAQTRLRSAVDKARSVYHRSLLDGDTARALDVRTVAPHLNIATTRLAATVKLAPRAFANAAAYLAADESAHEAALVQDYFDEARNGTAPNPGLVGGVRADVFRSSNLTLIWRQQQHSSGVAWVYVGTPYAFRIYPGHVHPSRPYDATTRAWYKRAVANGNAIAVSSPYEDASGAGSVVTVSRSIRLAADKTLLGVAGLDFTYGAFAALVDDAANCDGATSYCFVMDSSGFLVTHAGFGGSGGAATGVATENVFVGEYEPELAQQLLDGGVLRERTYYDVRSELQCRTYVVDPSHVDLRARGYVQGVLSGCHSGSYSVAPVVDWQDGGDGDGGAETDARTNLYLVVVRQYRVRFTCQDRLAAECAPPAAPSCAAMRLAIETNASRDRARAACPAFVLGEADLEALRKEETGNVCSRQGIGSSPDGATTGGIIAGFIIGGLLLLVAIFAGIGLCVWCSARSGAAPPHAPASSSSGTRRRRQSSSRNGGSRDGGSRDNATAMYPMSSPPSATTMSYGDRPPPYSPTAPPY